MLENDSQSLHTTKAKAIHRILRLTLRVRSRVRLYTSTTLTLSLYESNRYLLADNGVAINKHKFQNKLLNQPTYEQLTNHQDIQ